MFPPVFPHRSFLMYPFVVQATDSLQERKPVKHGISFAAVFAISLIFSVKDAVAQFPPNPQSAAFTGAWCAQGDPTKQASIADNGAFLTLTNENGDTSPGQYQGQNAIVAPGWQFVTGTLNQNGSQINWSNGTSGRGVIQAEAGING